MNNPIIFLDSKQVSEMMDITKCQLSYLVSIKSITMPDLMNRRGNYWKVKDLNEFKKNFFKDGKTAQERSKKISPHNTPAMHKFIKKFIKDRPKGFFVSEMISEYREDFKTVKEKNNFRAFLVGKLKLYENLNPEVINGLLFYRPKNN